MSIDSALIQLLESYVIKIKESNLTPRETCNLLYFKMLNTSDQIDDNSNDDTQFYLFLGWYIMNQRKLK